MIIKCKMFCQQMYIISHLPWQPVNLNVSHLIQFHLPHALFTHLMKNWGVPEIIAGEFLHICLIFRGICKRIKNDNLGLKTTHIFIIHTKE